MPSIIKLQGDDEIALTTANTVSGAKLVRIYNDQSTPALITHTSNDGSNTIGTFTISSKGVEFVEKDYTDNLAANVEVRAVKIGFRV